MSGAGWLRWRGRVAAGVAVAVLVPLLAAPAASAVPAPVYRGKIWSPFPLARQASVHGSKLVPGGRAGLRRRQAAALARLREPGSKPVAYRAPRVTWPAAGSGTAVLPRGAKAAGGARAGSLPVRVGPAAAGAGPRPSSVRVAVNGRALAAAAGINGVVLRVAAAPAPGAQQVGVSLSYAGFAGAYGGAWASRLHLVELPSCVLVTPGMPECRQEIPLPGANDPRARTVSAVVPLPGSAPAVVSPLRNPAQPGGAALFTAGLSAPGTAVLAAIAGPSGPAGDFTATPLNPAGKWAVQQGAFTYSYPVTVPPALGGTAPDVTLSYNSQSIDGETSVTNTQAGWIGDGWDYAPGFIERSYQPCSKDGITGSGDQCWGGWNATLSLPGGGSGPLVMDDITGKWHIQGDAGTQVQLLSGASNGLWNGEYWLVTTPDGTKYYFGRNHLPGGSGTDTASGSAWGVPVYSPNSGDPCYSSGSGQGSQCQMGWRWNLDYVVDPLGNLTSYSYQQETNYYSRGGGQNSGNGTLTQYVRGGFPARISYGRLLSDAIAGAQPAAEVLFGSSQRCTGSASECSSYSNLTSSTAADWPDTPFDQICGSSGSCTNYAPAYFSTYMLTSITTRALESGTYQPADSYALSQGFPSATGSNPVIYLNSITRTGQDPAGTAAASLPAVSFGLPVEMDNRIDGLVPSAPAVDRPRIEQVTTEAGAIISIQYDGAACSRVNGTMPASADSNTMPCFPVYWTPPNQSQILDWFNKTLIGQVTVADGTGAASPTQVTGYTYIGGAAWHQNESRPLPSANRTWDQYRGYKQVEVTTGAAPDPVTETMTYYMRGMDGDPLAAGGTKAVQLSDSTGTAYTDSDWLYGQVLETDAYNQAGGTPQGETLAGPWTYTQTASQAGTSGTPTLTARMLAQSQQRSRRLLASAAWQTSAATSSYFDSKGRLAATDTAPAGLPETCTKTAYATAPAGNPMMLAYPDQVTTVTGAYTGTACPAPSSGNIVTDSRTYYDNPAPTLSAPGTLGSLASPGGLVTGTAKAATWASGGSETWIAQSLAGYDAYGRVTSSTDANNHATATGYTPARVAGKTTELPTKVTVTNTFTWVTTTTLAQARQLPLTVTDPNGLVTTATYDMLGRRLTATTPLDQSSNTVTYKYSYQITGTSPPSVTTQTLREDGSFSQSVAIYDGMLQARQAQATPPSAASGRVITETFYDSHGWPVKSRAPYYDSLNAPGTALYVAGDGSVPGWTATAYDGQGRVTSSRLFAGNTAQWIATNAYPGMDETDVTPPPGGTPSSVFTDAAGRKTASWKYTTATPDGNSAHADVTSYAYTAAGQAASVTDNAGDQWTYAYNLLGEKTSSTDPGTTGTSGPSKKAGQTTYGYDSNGNLTTTTSPLGQQLTWTYDALNRKLKEYSGTATGTLLAAWGYDTTPLNGGGGARGQAASATSYDSAGNAYTQAVSGYDSSYHQTGTTTTIPAKALVPAATGTYSYTTATAYTPMTGLPGTTAYSADGGLPAETISYSQNGEGLLVGAGGNSAYLDNVIYTPLGQIQRTTFGLYGHQLVQTYTQDPATLRLAASTTSLQTLTSAADTIGYTYDPAGNITSATDAQNTGGTQAQCYTYSNLGQLTSAWTDTGGTTSSTSYTAGAIGTCANTAPAAANIGGAAPYWSDYTYSLLGDRTIQVTHDTASPAVDIPANAVTQAFTYPAAGSAAVQPDAATKMTATGPGGVTTTTNTYDAAGNTKTVTSTKTGTSPPVVPFNASAITYNPNGLVASVTTTGGTSSYLYDASGNLILQTAPAGTTLYLDNGTEQLTYTVSTKAVTGLRFYPSPDGSTVIRSSAGTITYETSNTQHTSLLAIDASSMTATRRYYDPYGNPVGTPPATWPDNHAYLGKPADTNTTLSLLGARQYNPAVGGFLSLDPVLQPGNPLTMGGYTYAADNPITNADPTGLHAVPLPGESCNAGIPGCPGYKGPPGVGPTGGWPAVPCPPTVSGCPGYAQLQTILARLYGLRQSLQFIYNSLKNAPMGCSGRLFWLGVCSGEIASGELGFLESGMSGRDLLLSVVLAYVPAFGEIRAVGVAGRAAEVAVDANPLIKALDEGAMPKLLAMLGGRAPVVSPRAALEYLGFETADAGRFIQFLKATGGRLGPAADAADALALRKLASQTVDQFGNARALKLPDAFMVSSAMQESLSLITDDNQVIKLLTQWKYPVEPFN